jgi:hypothetical protein
MLEAMPAVFVCTTGGDRDKELKKAPVEDEGNSVVAAPRSQAAVSVQAGPSKNLDSSESLSDGVHRDRSSECYDDIAYMVLLQESLAFYGGFKTAYSLILHESFKSTNRLFRNAGPAPHEKVDFSRKAKAQDDPTMKKTRRATEGMQCTTQRTGEGDEAASNEDQGLKRTYDHITVLIPDRVRQRRPFKVPRN